MCSLRATYISSGSNDPIKLSSCYTNKSSGWNASTGWKMNLKKGACGTSQVPKLQLGQDKTPVLRAPGSKYPGGIRSRLSGKSELTAVGWAGKDIAYDGGGEGPARKGACLRQHILLQEPTAIRSGEAGIAVRSRCMAQCFSHPLLLFLLSTPVASITAASGYDCL